MRIVITFDVADDRIRARLTKSLLARGSRVQKSVFEVPDLAPSAYLRMRSELERIVDPTTDSLRYYRLCETCRGRIEHHGVGPGLLGDQLDLELIE
ncbi:MAG: CRISPR-associated endonuclease Cas2 [Polyangiales bacterium]